MIAEREAVLKRVRRLGMEQLSRLQIEESLLEVKLMSVRQTKAMYRALQKEDGQSMDSHVQSTA